MHAARVGRLVFAATMIGLGLLALTSGTFPPIWAGVPKGFPAREAVLYLCAAVSLGTGAGLLVQRTARTAAKRPMVAVPWWNRRVAPAELQTGTISHFLNAWLNGSLTMT